MPFSFLLRRLKTGLIDLLPIAGFLLWLGVIAAAWVSLGGQAPEPIMPEPNTAESNHLASNENSRAPMPAADPARSRLSEKPAKSPPSAATNDATDTGSKPETKDRESAIQTAAAPTAKPDTPEQAKPSSAEISPPAASQAAAAASTHVARARFTNGIEHNEPVDRLLSVVHSGGQATRTLYYFTDLRGLAGQTVTYRWRYGGRVIAEVPVKVRANQFRAYSSKRLARSMTGRWTVVLTDSAGDTLSTASIIYASP